MNSTCDAQCVDLACGAALDSPQEKEEVEGHAAFLDAESFGVLDSATTSFGHVESAEALCSKLQSNSETRLPDGDLVEDHSTLVMVLRQKKPLHCPDSQCKMMLLVTSGFLYISSQTNHSQSR